MAHAMKWHFDILPEAQKELWSQHLAKGLPGWVLYGGTALALRLGHRTSVDFDFFSGTTFEPLEWNQQMGWGADILQAEPNTLTVIHKGVKLSFFGGLSLGVIMQPDMLDACPVASLDDLAGCKLAALVNRVELKDYLDVTALLRHGHSLAHLLGCSNAIYHGQFPVAACVKSIAWFDDPALKDLKFADRHLLEQSVMTLGEIPSIMLTESKIGRTS